MPWKAFHSELAWGGGSATTASPIRAHTLEGILVYRHLRAAPHTFLQSLGWGEGGGGRCHKSLRMHLSGLRAASDIPTHTPAPPLASLHLRMVQNGPTKQAPKLGGGGWGGLNLSGALLDLIKEGSSSPA